MGKEVKKCVYENGIYKKDINKGDTVFLEIGKIHKFYIPISLDYFDVNIPKENIEENIKNIKWAFILSSFWEQAEKHTGKVYSEWSNEFVGTEKINEYGIDKQYRQESFIIFNPQDKLNSWVGSSYQTLVFNKYPKESLQFNIVPYTDRHIKYAYFKKQEIAPQITATGIDDGCYQYGQEIEITIGLHRFAESKLEGKESSLNYTLKLYLTDKDGKILSDTPVFQESLSKYVSIPNMSGVNSSFKLYFEILKQWNEDYHGNDKTKDYSIKVVIEDDVNAYPFNTMERNLSIVGNTSKNEHTVRYETQNWFTVKKSPQELILKMEQDRTNMIQYIGDIEFTHKEFDPCGYSQIVVEEVEKENVRRNKRAPVIIFDEDAKVIDKTDTFFETITGDEKKKELKITLNKLRNKGVSCTGVMLEKGQKHNKKENVFQMHKVVLPYKNVFGNYEQEKDKTQTNDSDYKTDRKKKTADVSAVQGLEAGKDKDYTYDGENALKLKLPYMYDKSDYFWQFNYFFLNKEKAQTYFIPIGSCRYPNQIAKFRVYPDIKWEIYVLIEPANKTAESYAPSGMPSDKDSFGDPIVTDEKTGKPTRKNIFEIHQKKARETGVASKQFLKEYTAEFHVKATTNDSKNPIDIGVKIQETIQATLSILVGLKEALDELSHRNEAQKSGKAQGVMTALKGGSTSAASIPVFIEFTIPKVRIGGGWQFDIPDYKSPEVKCVGNLQFGFEPLVEAKGGIDLIAAAEYIYQVRLVLKALSYVKKGAQWLSDNTPVKLEAEVYFNLYAKGKVDLRYTMDFYNSTNDKLDLKASLLFGLELGFKIKATIEKIAFIKGGPVEGETVKTGIEGEVSAALEAGFELKATGGSDSKGLYIEARLDFTGAILVGKGKLTIFRPGKSPKVLGGNFKEEIIGYHPNIIKERYYVS